MKKETCAFKTKRKLAEALRELMRTTAFDKITVSDITERCGLHRQTFYYHFQDRNQLLSWLIYEELFVPLIEGVSVENVYEHFDRLFRKMYQDKQFYTAALQMDIRGLLLQVTATAKEYYGLIISGLTEDATLENACRENLVFADFFCCGIAGIILEWALDGMKETPQEMTEKIKHLSAMCQKIAGC